MKDRGHPLANQFAATIAKSTFVDWSLADAGRLCNGGTQF